MKLSQSNFSLRLPDCYLGPNYLIATIIEGHLILTNKLFNLALSNWDIWTFQASDLREIFNTLVGRLPRIIGLKSLLT